MSSHSRRAFLARSFAASAGASLTLGGRALAIDPISRSRPGHLKLSIAAYSYRQFLQGESPKLDLFGFADLAADMGLDAIEPTSYYFPKDVDSAYLNRLKVHAFRLGLDISGTAVGNNFCVPPGPERDEQIAQLKVWIDRAAELDAPVIRIFAGNVPKGSTEDEAVARTIEAIDESLEYAAAKGVCLALENHGGITATPDQLLRIVQAVEAPHGNFGVNFDSGNFRTEDPYGDLAKIAPYAINAQIKTEIQRKGEEKEPADLTRLVQILRDAKYTGYVVLEYEAPEDPFQAIPEKVKALRDIIG